MDDHNTRKREIQINFRLLDTELDMLTELEASTGENKSQILRRLIRKAHKSSKRG